MGCDFTFKMIQFANGFPAKIIFLHGYDDHRALCRSRNHPVEIDMIFRHDVDALKSRSRENSAVPVVFFKLAQTGVDVTAQVSNLVMRISVEPLCLSAQTAGGN